MIGIIICSRGLIFAKVFEAIVNQVRNIDHKFYISYDLEIPDCQNVKTEEALKDGCKSLLFIEEDTVIPSEGFGKLININTDIAYIDYGVNGYSCATRDKKTHEILWCGLGCTLIKRKVFDALEKPYFRSDKALLLNYWPEIRWINTGNQAYGGQDIYFCVKAREKGFKIARIEGECEHLKLNNLGRVEINKGIHDIGVKPKISNYQEL